MKTFRDISILIPRTWSASDESDAIAALISYGVPRSEISVTRADTDDVCVDALHPIGSESALYRVLVDDLRKLTA